MILLCEHISNASDPGGDRAWFERRPTRLFRVRKLTKSERVLAAQPYPPEYVLTVCLEDGIRIRSFFAGPKGLRPETDEEI